MQQRNGCVLWCGCVVGGGGWGGGGGGVMSQVPLCCKTTEDKQKRHITSSPSHLQHEERGAGSGLLRFYYVHFLMISSIFLWGRFLHVPPHRACQWESAVFLAVASFHRLCNFPALTHPQTFIWLSPPPCRERNVGWKMNGSRLSKLIMRPPSCWPMCTEESWH